MSLSVFIIVFLLIFSSEALPAITPVNQARKPEQHILSVVPVQKDTLVVGSEQNYPPFAIGMTDATADGFTVDLWKAVAAEVGLNYTIRVRPFHEILQEFKNGKVDVLINLAQSEERHQFADFTVPHVTIHGAIFVRKGDAQIHSENDLVGKAIIVLNADLAHDYALAKGWEKQLVLVDTTEQGLRLLASGKHDAMLLSKLAGLQTLRDLKITNIRALDVNAGFKQKFSFAVHKGEADLLAKINEGLALTKTRNTFDQLYEKWFQPYEEKQVTFWDVLPYLAPIALVLLSISGYEFYKRQIELKRTAAQLALSARVFNEAREAILITDAQGTIIDVNLTFCEITGYSKDEVIGQNLPLLNSGIHGSEFFNMMWAELEKQDYWQSELWNHKKDGELYCEHIRISTLRDEGGKVIHYVGFFSDISERKRIELELADKEQHLSTLISTTPVGLFETDQEGKCTYVNERWSEITGLPFEMARADGWINAVHPEDKKKVFTEWVASVSEKRPFHLEYRFQHTDGKITYVIGQTRESRSVTGELVGYIGTITDISERKKADHYEQFRSNILEQLATNKPLSNILEALANGVEQINPDMLCNILLLDDEGKHFLKCIGPSLPDFYKEAIKGAEIGIGVGACGTAAFTGELVIVEDIATHPYWTPYKELAARAELRASWSQPIISSYNQVLGTISIYHHQTYPPNAADIYLIEQSARLASLAIERKQYEMELRIAATAFDSQEGMIVTDASNNILRVNSAFTAITGYTAEEVVGKNPSILQSGQHDAGFYTAMWESINTKGSWQGEIWNQRKSGDVFPERLTITAVKDQNGIISNYVATLTDITLQKEAVNKIEQLAFYDPLTGLPNRRLLQDRLKLAFAASHRSGRQGALLFIDIDNFKTLNDTYGHDVGDLLLKQVAQRLESCVRECDTVARLGGDEFVVMLEDLNEQALDAAMQTEIIGHKIMDILNLPYQLNTKEYHSTPSIGVTVFNGQEQSSEELLKQADIAMYQAKNSGRNTLRFFNQTMQAAINARVSLEEDLRLGLKGNQFILYYQPQVHQSGQIIGAEVLIRWQHPLRGLILPAEFISLAEETQLILTIGEWVLKTACAQLKIWEGSDHTRHLQLAVNVSARQFHQTDFVDQVSQILNFNAINPKQLKLELTESLVLNDIDDTILKMNALRKIGVSFSMDDFGTGYSSLSSLKKLPLDQLKIDKSFVRDISIDQDNTIIVETITAMANKLKMEVIAEGVETEGQRNFLERHNCLLFQGYLFSRPVPIEQFEWLLKNSSL